MSINNKRAAPGATGSGSHFTFVNWGCVGLDYGDEYNESPGETQALKLKALRRDFPIPPCALPFNHPDTLEVMQTFNGERLTKLYADKTFTAYDHATWFAGHCVDVSTDALLLALLRTLARRWDCAIVHGRIVKGVHSACMLRRASKLPITMVDHRRSVFAIDIDTVALPPGLNPFDLENCAAYVRSLLPLAFRRARCIAVATSGYCIKDGLRFRFWFRFDRPLSCAELKRWLQNENAPVDLSPMHPIGFAYTADPLFADPADDPLPGGRLVILDGDPAVTTPDSEALQPPTYPPRKPVIPRQSRAGKRCSSGGGVVGGAGGDSAGGCRSKPGGIGHLVASQMLIEGAVEGERHTVILRECFRLMTYIFAGFLDEEEAREGILESGLSIGKGKNEIDNAFNYALRKEGESHQREQKHKLYDENDWEVEA
jgi:hypothetical protein